MNRVGKKIRFRRKKKEKLKTENRAKKALKTISLILGSNGNCANPANDVVPLVFPVPSHLFFTFLFLIKFFLLFLFL